MSRFRQNLKRIGRRLDEKFLRPGHLTQISDTIIIEPTNCCNLRCSCCPNGHGIKPRLRGMMNAGMFNSILESIDIPYKKVFLHLHGEPTLNPDLPAIARKLSDRGKIVNIYSNGVAVTAQMAEAIVSLPRTSFMFSVDAASESHYRSIRCPATLDATLSNLDLMNEVMERHKTPMRISVIAPANNPELLEPMCEMLFKRYSRLTSINISSRFPWPRLPQTGDIEGHLRSAKRRTCREISRNPVITWNGDVTMCSYDFSGEMIIGSLLDRPMSRLINSTRARAIRNLHNHKRLNETEPCANCLLDRFMPLIADIKRRSFLNASAEERSQMFEPFFIYYQL